MKKKLQKNTTKVFSNEVGEVCKKKVKKEMETMKKSLQGSFNKKFVLALKLTTWQS